MSSDVTRISTLDGSCVRLPPMIEARACHGAFADEGRGGRGGRGGSRICVIGGLHKTYERRLYVEAEALDTAEPTWHALEVQLAK